MDFRDIKCIFRICGLCMAHHVLEHYDGDAADAIQV